MTSGLHELNYESAPVGLVATLRRKLLGPRNRWALCDQVLISGANFVTMVLVARGLTKSAFGEFSLVYAGLLFVNLLQAALVTQPHNVLGASLWISDRNSYRRYTASSAAGQLSLTTLEILAAIVLALIGHARGWTFEPLLIALVPAVAAWQFQEFIRRVLYSESRTRAALVNDVVSYGGQGAWIALLWWQNRLTAPLAIYVLAATSAAATLLGLWQIRHSIARQASRAFVAENWHFGKWLLGSELLNWCASTSFYLYIVSVMLSTSATGELRAVQTLFGPARIFSFFLCTILPIQFAQTLSRSGSMAVHKQFKSVASIVIPAMAAYCLLMAIFAHPILKLAYGASYAGSATILILYAQVAFLSYVQMLITAALLSRGMTRFIFMGSCCAALTTAAVSWLAIDLFKLPGAVGAMIVTQAVVTGVLFIFYLRTLHRSALPKRAGEAIQSVEATVAPVA